MPDKSSTPNHYDRVTIALHWLTALLVTAMWILGQTIDWFPKGTPRVSARSTHIVTGTLLAIVVLSRIGWRTMAGRRLPPADDGWLRVISTGTHFTLYTLLVTTASLGLANAWMRGDQIFAWFKIPALFPGNRPLTEWIENAHGLSADTLAVVAALHALAGLAHHFVFRDRVLQRMKF